MNQLKILTVFQQLAIAATNEGFELFCLRTEKDFAEIEFFFKEKLISLTWHKHALHFFSFGQARTGTWETASIETLLWILQQYR